METRVRNVTLNCPDVVFSDVYFDCFLHVASGTKTTATVEIDDGTSLVLKTLGMCIVYVIWRSIFDIIVYSGASIIWTLLFLS